MRRYPFGCKRAWNVWAVFTSVCKVIQRHAGHEKYATTEGYVHEAEDYRGNLGLVFPPLSPDQAPAGFGANDQESIRGGKTIRNYGKNSVPKGIRTPVTALKGPCPGPG